MFCWFCFFFSKKKFQSCAKHIWISDHNGRDAGDRAGREREGGRDHSTSGEKKGTATLLFGNHKQKMHSSGLKRLNQTPTPVCTGIYSGASRTGHTHPACTPTHTHTHPDTDRQQKQEKETQPNPEDTPKEMKHLQWLRINKNLHKTRHIL